MLTFQAIQFRCTLHSDAVLPPYKGSTFRGAFGTSLKRIVCAVRERECAACLLATRCLYARVFESLPPTVNESSSVPPPSPYLIEPDSSPRTHYCAGDSFGFNLLLFGEFVHSLPYFIYAVETMGEGGVGKKLGDRRPRFSVNQVTVSGTAIYDPAARRLVSEPPPQLVPPPTLGEEMSGRLTIALQIPLRLKNDNRLTDKVDFKTVIRAALRRVSAMHAAYGAGDPPLDYRGLIAEAASVKTVESTLSWHDWKRYSNRQQDEMLFGGLVGNISFMGNIGPFMQIMEQARLMHIGKQTTFGLGGFDYRWEPENK